MKKLKNLFIALILCAPLTVAAQSIEINEENFPDENFRKYVFYFDEDKDNMLSIEEINKVTGISLSNEHIVSMKGIEYFTALKSLSCDDNAIKSLDVSKNIALESLGCHSNAITSLDLSKNIALRRLDCSYNQLTSLDLSNNIALRELVCGHNLLTTLDVSNNTALELLNFKENKLTSLDVSKNIALDRIYCYNNQLTVLDLSSNVALKELDCYLNPIKGESMDALISSLPQNEGTSYNEFRVYYNGGNEIVSDNVITKSQVAAAKAKGWMPLRYNASKKDWEEYEGMDDTASIAQPETENSTAEVYTLHGQKVTAPQKGGIYVVNGKKVVVK